MFAQFILYLYSIYKINGWMSLWDGGALCFLYYSFYLQTITTDYFNTWGLNNKRKIKI